jgi:replicative DNA helicase
MTQSNELYIEAERALLSAIIIEGSAHNIIPEINITVTDFTTELHQDIFRAVLKCELPNIITVPHQMWVDKKLTPNDLQYIRDMIADCPNSLEYESYAIVVKEYSKAREGLRKPCYKGAI